MNGAIRRNRPSRGVRFITALVLGAPLAVASLANSDESPRAARGIEVAIVPFLPPRTLVGNYQPMRAHLEQSLREPVTIITAPDYLTFFERTARRNYQIVVTLAHAAWLAHTDAGYQPILRPVGLTYPVTVVARDSPWTKLKDLRGRALALPDSLAVISAQAMEMLRQGGFDPGRDFSLRHYPTHSAAINHVVTGEAAAAVVSNRALQQMAAETRAVVRVIDSWERGAAPGVVWLADPALPRERAEQIAAAVLAFTESSAEGRALMQQWGYGGLARASPDDLRALAPYGQWLRTEIIRARERKKPFPGSP